MATLNQAEIKQAIQEINESDEINRRLQAQERLDMYRDGGKRFLIEQILKEFGQKALSEMRLCPLNVLKKIVDKKSAVYKKGAVRRALNQQDQPLVDYYVAHLRFDEKMMKANRYFNLFSNTALYVLKNDKNQLTLNIIPPTLYSIMPKPMDQTKVKAWIFSQFLEDSNISQEAPLSATGHERLVRERGNKSKNDLVASDQYAEDQQNRFYIFWTDEQHFTTDKEGNVIVMDPNQGEEQFINPIGRAPVVNLTKDRDNETWAQQGSDMVDLALTIQLGFSDLFTIAKNQGFSILMIKSTEEPRQLQVGINKAVWLKQTPENPDPSISYVQAQAPVAEIKELILDTLGLLLSTNDMNPGSITSKATGDASVSGFSKLIDMADTIEAVQRDIPILRDAEIDVWDVIKRCHNYMFDNDVLHPEARAFGRFAEDFSISVSYPEQRPMESEQEKIANIKELIALGLITNKDALKKLNPDKTEEEIDAVLIEISEEKSKVMEEVNTIQRGINNGSDQNNSGPSGTEEITEAT